MRRLAPAFAAILAAGAPALALAAPVLLQVTQVEQEHTLWCWAGTSRTVLLHFGVDQPQCALAEYARTHTTASDVNLGTVDCCVDWQQGCNNWNYFWFFGGSIADILDHYAGLQNLTFERALSLAEIQQSLDVGRLVLVRWVWSNGSGHFLLIHGYEGTATYYMDPWPGEGLKVAEYDWMYLGGDHTWATSLTAGRPAASCAQDGNPCDDGDRCTVSDRCAGGACQGTPVVCQAPVCQQRACEAATGECAPATFLPAGSPCDDGDPCTENDGCLYGACEGSAKGCPATECQAAGACSPSTGQCAGAPVADGTACSGGTCQAGECQAKSGGCSAAGGGSPLAAMAALALLATLRRRRG
ncbi:MAG TPA: C39 family peptidase [Myxococcales bacterium]|jgi:uncharacterized protein (TIGR03382 family)